LATPNYGYEKRQRELAKKKKKEDKLRAKAANARHPADAGASEHGGGDDGSPQPAQGGAGQAA